MPTRRLLYVFLNYLNWFYFDHEERSYGDLDVYSREDAATIRPLTARERAFGPKSEVVGPRSQETNTGFLGFLGILYQMYRNGQSRLAAAFEELRHCDRGATLNGYLASRCSGF